MRTRPLRAVTSSITMADRPTSADVPDRSSGGCRMWRTASGRTTPRPAPAVTAKAASWTGRPRPTAPTMAATTAATASSPNASVAVTTSATPSSAAKTSHTIHDPMVTPGAGAAGEKPTYRANVRGSPTSLYLTVTPPWRADAMTGEPAHPLAKGLRQASLSETVTVPRHGSGTVPSTEPRRGRSCRHFGSWPRRPRVWHERGCPCARAHPAGEILRRAGGRPLGPQQALPNRPAVSAARRAQANARTDQPKTLRQASDQVRGRSDAVTAEPVYPEHQSTTLTFSAWGPFWPCVMSNSTFCPASRLR